MSANQLTDDPTVARFRRAAWRWLTGAAAEAPAAAAAPVAPTPEVPVGPSAEVIREHLQGVIEAIVFASDRPMTEGDIARASRSDKKTVRAILAELVAFYRPRGFRLDEVAGGYAFRTSPAFAPFVRDMAAKKPVRMSRAQIETLAIIAYRQPITRPEVDDIRGVDSGAVMKALLDRDLLRVLGKRDEPGRPILYGTTANFLEFFGLKSLSDLPTLREFTELTDESRVVFEREIGEEAPLGSAPSFAFDPGGMAGGEGSLGISAADLEDAEESAGASEAEEARPADAEPAEGAPAGAERAEEAPDADDEAGDGEDEDDDEGEGEGEGEKA